MIRFKPLLSDLVRFSRSARAQRWLKLSTSLFPVAVGALLAYQLSGIGWGDMCRSIPTSPLFYLLFLVQYLALPGFDALIFARIWRCGFWRLLPATCLKHVYNQDVVELSGEAYFYVWSTKRLGRDPGQTLRTVKDVSILSAVAGYRGDAGVAAGVAVARIVRSSPGFAAARDTADRLALPRCCCARSWPWSSEPDGRSFFCPAGRCWK